MRGSQASVWIPYEAGIFRKNGLDVELLYVAGGGRAGQVVQSGEELIGVFTGGAVINANLASGDLVEIASSMNVMTFVVMARPEIKRIEDLKGKKIGVSRFGSHGFGLLSAEEKWPVKRQRDFAVIQSGGVTDVYNALRAGALDAGVINAELAIPARREGYRELADIAKLAINFPTSSIGHIYRIAPKLAGLEIKKQLYFSAVERLRDEGFIDRLLLRKEIGSWHESAIWRSFQKIANAWSNSIPRRSA